MTIRVRHKAAGILATTSQDPRVLGNAWEIVEGEPAEVEKTDGTEADKPADESPAESNSDDSGDASDQDEDGADDGDSAADGRGDEPAKGAKSSGKSVRRGTTRKSAKSDTDETA